MYSSAAPLHAVALDAAAFGAHRTAVETLAAAVERRDEYTGGHIVRVRDYALALAHRVDPVLSREDHAFGYMLHDIGKLAVPGWILRKPGPLTAAEQRVVRSHTTEGVRYLSGFGFLEPSIPVVRSHHEHWDGTGYPDGLRREQIPLIARVFAIADALDAMTTDRPYRRAIGFERALDEIVACAATQFDPDLVVLFEDVARTHSAFAPLRSGRVPERRRRSARPETFDLVRGQATELASRQRPVEDGDLELSGRDLLAAHGLE